jgi:hypothetical protein
MPCQHHGAVLSVLPPGLACSSLQASEARSTHCAVIEAGYGGVPQCTCTIPAVVVLRRKRSPGVHATSSTFSRGWPPTKKLDTRSPYEPCRGWGWGVGWRCVARVWGVAGGAAVSPGGAWKDGCECVGG